ncbi:MAG TPA: asparagine synthase (glutamine-hydrolyzing) [Gemmataceae bacterium]|jgi:asparagine synthase (glutamine-hydrolysing)|nr:asparagine synthase (glutamine-hydrolyzing) [Gemmataceae bacterium]
MCGIAGVIDLAGRRAAPPGTLRRMADAIVHRGPDDDGYLDLPHLGLANRRLSIVGLADGKQPIGNEDGAVQCVFNGEFFDYPERRAELEAKGHRFRTHTDTELIPHLWEEYGEAFFDNLKGQFAFCLYDTRRNVVVLARDRFGICPLYWTVRRQGETTYLLFASEIRALLASGMVPAEADLRGLNHVFTFFAQPGPITCFKGVNLLLPGHYLRVRLSESRDAAIEERTYWELDFPDCGHEENPPERRAVDEYERLFVQSVERRLRADVPVVSYLSGGVDSSVVAAVASKVLGRPIPTFTIAVRAAGFDESTAAALVARHIGSQPIVAEYAHAEVRDTYPELIAAAEFPVIDTSAAALLRLAGTVHAKGFKVALTGEGADEFLAGYPWFKIHRILNQLEVVPGVRVGNLLRAAALRITGQPRFPMHLLRDAQDAVGGHNGWLDLYGMMSLSKLRFYSDDLKRDLVQMTPYAELGLNREKMLRWHPFHRSIALGARIMLPGHLLASKGDRVAMWNSVELRPPFLDEDLVGFTNRLHPRWKLRRLQDKYLLRRMAERWVPHEIAWRRKKMFRAPLDSFHLTGNGSAWINEVLSPESLRKTGYFDAEAVAKSRAEVTTMRRGLKRTSVEMGLAAVTATQLWHHLFVSGDLAAISTRIVRMDSEPLAAAG